MAPPEPTHAQGLYIVTGARSGIGRAVSEALLKKGYHVLGVSRRISQDPIAAERFSSFDLDLSKLDDLPGGAKVLLKQALLITAQHQVPLQGAVFCAGMGRFGQLEQLSQSAITTQIDLNLSSQIILTKGLIAQFKRQQQGLLIYIGSEAGLNGRREGTVYCATKFGLRGFVQALNEECSASAVRATIVNPGMVDTPFFDTLHFQPGKDAHNAIAPTTLAQLIVSLTTLPLETVVDEVTLSPRKKVVLKK